MPVYNLNTPYRHLYTAGVIIIGLTLPVFMASNIQASQPQQSQWSKTETRVNQVLPDDGTPLIIAVRDGDESRVQALLRHGADVNLASLGDGNPLIVAASQGNTALARLLIEYGADVNSIVPGDETPLINAARASHIEMVRYLIDQGADVNLGVNADTLRGKAWRTPLNQAARPDIRELLRQHGASDDAKSEGYQ